MKRTKPLNRNRRVALSGPWRVRLAVVTIIIVGVALEEQGRVAEAVTH